LHGRIVFLVDYDMLVAEQLVQGADVWINTPRRPWEACGTSGMKVLVNGGLNLSELDGWWAEAYQPGLGWAIGDRREHHSDPAWDAAEADQLYTLLEQEIIPGFYQRNALGIPETWVQCIRASIITLTPHFSTNRMLREYLQDYYLPAAQAQRHRQADDGAIGRQLAAWRSRVTRHWQGLHWDQLHAHTDQDGHHLSLHLYLDDLGPDDIQLECFAEPLDDRPAERHVLRRGEALPGAINGFLYTGLLPTERPLSHYTPRIIPAHPEALVPLELNLITWIEGGFRTDN
jgi:starch phosphorylase